MISEFHCAQFMIDHHPCFDKLWKTMRVHEFVNMASGPNVLGSENLGQ